MWLKEQQNLIKDDVDKSISDVLKHCQYIMGPEVNQLEDILAKYIGCKYAISCSSGTDALLLALMAYGVGPNTTIFTTPFTFVSTAEAAALLGATIIFIDIDPITFNIDVNKLEKYLSMYNLRTSAGIIAVDLFGLPADYERLKVVADTYEMFIIEDAAQSIGGELLNKKSGNLASVGCTSFFPTKPLGCYGDGGMCFTDNMIFASKMKSIRSHGKGDNKYDYKTIGINGRIDTIQAAILLSKFKIFEDEVEKRQVVAERYYGLLKDIDSITLPYIPSGFKSAWAQYSILAKNEKHRELLMNKLKDEGIDTVIYYPKPLHLQDAFRNLYYLEGDFPVSENCSKRIFSIPMHPYITFEEQKKLAEVICDTYI